jgi:hypothetical protein
VHHHVKVILQVDLVQASAFPSSAFAEQPRACRIIRQQIQAAKQMIGTRDGSSAIFSMAGCNLSCLPLNRPTSAHLRARLLRHFRSTVCISG